MLRYILAWVPMILLGIFNGTLREVTYGKRLSELRAHQISTVIGILLFGIYVWGVLPLLGIESFQAAFLVGAIWLGLTIGFEFLFGHYIAKQPWSKLLGDYNLLAGRVWLFVLLWIAVSPVVFYRLLL